MLKELFVSLMCFFFLMLVFAVAILDYTLIKVTLTLLSYQIVRVAVSNCRKE